MNSKKHPFSIVQLTTHASVASVRMACATFKALLVCALLQAGGAYAQNIWTGSAGTTNWSTPGNWSFGAIPTSSDTVLFDNVVVASPAAVVDNIVDTGFTIFGLTYQTVSTNGFHTSLLPAGLSLNLNGSGTDAIFVGTGIFQGTGQNTYSRIVGPGTLTVTNSAGAIRVMQWGDNNDHRATLDLSGLTNFSADVAQVLVATTRTTSEQYMQASLLLAETNFIHTAAGATQPGVLVGSMDNGSTGKRSTQQIFLGRNNTIYSDAVSIGGFKMDGALQVRGGITDGLTTLRGSAGGSDPVKILSVGDHRAGPADYLRNGTSAAVTGTFDTTGNFLDALVQDLFVARAQTNNSGLTTGTLTLNQGTLTADNMNVGYHQSPSANNAAFNAVGTVNVNGTATLSVNNDLVLARKVGTNIPTGTLNLSATGTVNVKGNILNSGGNSTINFNNGGTINMQPGGDVTPGNITVSTLSGSGSIINAGNVTNTSSLSPGGAATAGTLSIGGNLTLASGESLNLNLTNVTTAGGNVNDLVSVTGNLTLNNNAVNLVPNATTLATGSYRLVDYTGSQSGLLSFANPTRYSLSLDYGTANQINLVNSGGSPGSVTWNGSTNNNWNLTATNWNNNTDKFYQFDAVTFDNTGLNTNVNLAVAVYPSAVTVNSSTNYFFTGSGKIGGGASLTKSGPGTLRVATANDFTGPVTISGGIFQMGNATALGTTNSGTTVVSGGTLDVSGTSFFSPGELVTIAGTGLNNTGAVINTGAGQNNAIRFLTLSDNASVRTDNRFDVRGPGGSGSFSGALDLNGFTLTKFGAAQMSLVDSVITNAGSIEIAGGFLGLTRSLIDGPGYINISSNIALFENFSTGYVAKPFSSSGGILRATGNAITLGVPITNLSGLTMDTVVALTVTNVISGAGSLIKSNTSTLQLDAANTYAGATRIVGGRLILNTNASLATSGVEVGPGTVFDASAVAGGFVLASGQTLSGSGGVFGDVSAGSGTAVIPGTSAGTLTFSNQLTLNNSSSVFELAVDPTQVGNNVNDLILVNSNLTLSGLNTVKVVPLATLNNASPYTLFQYTGTLSGNEGNLTVGSDSRYAFTVVPTATTPGSIQVNVSGAGTSANLVWKGGNPGNPTAWDTKVTSNWLNGVSLDVFYLGDNVLFDDLALTNFVSLVGTVQPATVIFSNSVVNYTIGGAGSLVAGSLSHEGSAALSFSNSAANTVAAGFTNDAGTVTFANTAGNTFAAGATINAGTVNLVNPGGNTFAQPLAINGGSVVFNQPGDVTFSSVVSDNGAGLGTLEKLGATTLTLSGNNAGYNGAILGSAGTLKAGNANALGTAVGGTTIASGATLDVNALNLGSEPVTVSGTGVSGNGAIVNTGAGQNNALGDVTLAGNTTFGGTGRWDIRNAPSRLSTGGNPYNLTKFGANQFSLVSTTVDPMLADIDVQSGIFSVEVTSTLGDSLKTARIWSGATLQLWALTAANPLNKMLVFSNSATLLNGSGVNVVSGPVSLEGAATFNVGGTSLQMDGAISGAGSLSKIGGNLLILDASNSYAGGTLISAGTVQLGLNGTTGNLPPQPSGVLTNNGTLIFNRSDDVTFNDQITGAGGVQQIAGGTVFLTASNSYSGQTVLNTTTVNSPAGAVLRISHSNALGDTTGNTTINGNTTGNSTLELVGNITVPEAFSLSARQGDTTDTPHIRNVSGNNTITGNITGTTGGSQYNIQSDSGKLTMVGNFVPPSTAGTRLLKLMGDGNGEWSGIISNSVDTLVPALVLKTNLGTWTLSGTNVYRGSTTISEGTLALAATGSISNTPTIDVRSNATLNVAAVPGGFVLGTDQTLMGNGTVIGNVTANGIVAPGASIGTLTFANNLVLAGTNVMEIDRDGTPANADLIAANGLTYGGTLVVNNIGLPLQSGDTFNLFDAASVGGTFAATNLPALDPGLSWDLSSLSANGTIKVASSVSTTPTNLTFQVTGGTLDISWPSDHTGWRLESQTNNLNVGITTNWSTVPGSPATNRVILDIDRANGTVFFRLAYP